AGLRADRDYSWQWPEQAASTRHGSHAFARHGHMCRPGHGPRDLAEWLQRCVDAWCCPAGPHGYGVRGYPGGLSVVPLGGELRGGAGRVVEEDLVLAGRQPSCLVGPVDAGPGEAEVARRAERDQLDAGVDLRVRSAGHLARDVSAWREAGVDPGQGGWRRHPDQADPGQAGKVRTLEIAREEGNRVAPSGQAAHRVVAGLVRLRESEGLRRGIEGFDTDI